ncbi:MAG: hypothetical protein IPN85_18880 [Flavobacteriales bacterium]|nr:hypothetical protein [Flavobacteriales bacterium]
MRLPRSERLRHRPCEPPYKHRTDETLSIVSILAISALGTLSTGCGKYEDGPDFSLRSRASRIANTWKVESARKGGDDVTSSFTQYELNMTKDGDATLTANYELGDVTFSTRRTGPGTLRTRMRT